MKIRPAAILEEEGRLLLLHYRHPGGEVYGIPGGGVEPGESLRRTLVREMEEELGLEVKVEDLLLAAEAPPVEGLPRTLHLLFRCRRCGGEPEVRGEHTSAAGCCWLALESLDQVVLYPHVGASLRLALKRPGAPYVEDLPPREWR